MPKKGASTKDKKNNQLWTTLPAGARFQLDQLVALETEGDSHSEVIRAIVIAQLRVMRKEYNLTIKEPGSAAEENNGEAEKT
jgi:hypothetical protein